MSNDIELYYIKLRTGEQVLALLGGVALDEEDEPESVLLVEPVYFKIIPEQGPWMQHFLLLSESKQVQMSMDDIMFLNEASETGHKYYDKFFEQYGNDRGKGSLNKHPSGDGPLDHDTNEELDEDTLRAILESTKATKH